MFVLRTYLLFLYLNPPDFDSFGEILKPMSSSGVGVSKTGSNATENVKTNSVGGTISSSGGSVGPTTQKQQEKILKSNDIDGAMAMLAGNLSVKQDYYKKLVSINYLQYVSYFEVNEIFNNKILNSLILKTNRRMNIYKLTFSLLKTDKRIIHDKY